MACDEGLVERIRLDLKHQPGVGEIRMFGGVCFTLNGNMMVGVVKDELMVRVGAEAYEGALRKKHARIMDFAKRPMKGYVYVGVGAIEEDRGLHEWSEAARPFVQTLPPKLKKTATPKTGPTKARGLKIIGS